MITHSVLRQYSDASANRIAKTDTVTGNVEKNIDASIAIASNTLVAFTLDRSALQSLCLYSDVAITIYTNAASGGSPTDTIALVAGQALVWSLATDGLARCPITANVTALYITNAAATASAFKLRALLT